MNESHGRHLAAPIVSACGSGDVEFLESWARAGDAFVNCLRVDGNGAKALMSAVRGNHPECVLFMLQRVETNAVSPEGRLPLVEASKFGRVRVMRILLDHGADPNLSDARSSTALVLAVGKGFRDAVLLLLERGASVNLRIDGGRTALFVATMNGHLEIMRDLFAAGADPNMVDQCGVSPLYMAISNRRLESAELLLAMGADVTLTTFRGKFTALMAAACEGYAHLAARILAKAEEGEGEGEGEGGGEAFVNARDYHGGVALMGACRRGLESVVRVLLQHPKIDIDVQDDIHNTALLYALSNNHAGIAEALLTRGASVKPDARAGTSVLIYASAYGRHDLVRLILERGAENACVNFRAARGETALMWACQRDFPETVKILLQAGAAVDALNTAGWTPLMYAGRESAAEMTHLLLERGADPNVHGPTTTPLILACARSAPGFGAACQALIRAGANVHAKNSDGATALQIAIDNNNKEAVKALLNSGAGVHVDNGQRQLVEYIYELKREVEALVQVFPHALALSSRGSALSSSSSSSSRGSALSSSSRGSALASPLSTGNGLDKSSI